MGGDALLAEVTRGGRVESRHLGAAVIADSRGRILFSAGNIHAPHYPRSAVKAMLALPLVESGAADRLGLDDAELVLACASHTGEARHVEACASMLRKAGRDASCLECGTHWPVSRAASHALATQGKAPNSLHNNCSGKHAGFVCLACDRGEPVAGYVRPEHPVMQTVAAALADLTGTALDMRDRAVDGCGIPTYAIPLLALATGFARFGSGEGLAPGRARAAGRLRRAVAADPFMVGGSGRFDTRLMELLGARVFSKTGAEGVLAAALPEEGLGIAVKCHDGSARAAEVALAALIARRLELTAAQQGRFETLLNPKLANWNGEIVGEIRPGPLG
jgi:L-asparaginase II